MLIGLFEYVESFLRAYVWGYQAPIPSELGDYEKVRVPIDGSYSGGLATRAVTAVARIAHNASECRLALLEPFGSIQESGHPFLSPSGFPPSWRRPRS